MTQVGALRQMDPGCVPLRRNPAALCRVLIGCGDLGQLRTALRLVREGCEAALLEKASDERRLHTPNPDPDPPRP